MSAPRALVIRGGAVGDFILTLPAIRLLREGLPVTPHLEILGYPNITALAETAGLADATHPLEHGGLAPFFVPGADLDARWSAYFESFTIILSYLFDPDDIFHTNLARVTQATILPRSLAKSIPHCRITLMPPPSSPPPSKSSPSSLSLSDLHPQLPVSPDTALLRSHRPPPRIRQHLEKLGAPKFSRPRPALPPRHALPYHQRRSRARDYRRIPRSSLTRAADSPRAPSASLRSPR